MTTTTERDALDAHVAVRAWVRRRARLLAVVTALALGLCVVTAWSAATTSRWKSDLLRSGHRASGIVTRVSTYRDKSGGGDDVRIAVASEPPFDIVVDTPKRTYRVGDRVSVFYDPANRRHARTDRFTTDDDWWTVAATVVAVAAGAGVAVAIVAAWYLALVAVLGRSLQATTVTASVRRPFGRGQYRRILTFADTGPEPWSTTLHEAAMRQGRVHVAGRRLWRLVWFPAGRRPYVLRRARTPWGRWAWRRALRQKR